jgi:hypothetical protein
MIVVVVVVVVARILLMRPLSFVGVRCLNTNDLCVLLPRESVSCDFLVDCCHDSM